MNILFISTENPYPPDHGHHIRTFHILKGLAENNSIYFIGFAKSKKELEFTPALESICKKADIFMLSSGSRWGLLYALFANLFSRFPFIVQRYYNSAARRRVAEILNSHKIDLVHIDLLHVSRYSKDVASIPKVLVNHNVESIRFWRRIQTERNLIVKLYFYFQFLKLHFYEKRICLRFDKCVTVSDVDKDYLIKLCGKDNFATIPNGVDLDYFKPNGYLQKPDSLVWVGAMSSAYNADAVDYFLDRIWPLLQSEIPDLKVSFVGASPTKLLKKKAAENQKIKICGYVHDVRSYMAKASVFIAPMRSGSGTNIKILNALSMAMPVVTTPVGVEGIQVVDNESILVAKEARDFAEKTIRVLRAPEFARRLGKEGRRVIERHYDWNAIHHNNSDLYKQIVN